MLFHYQIREYHLYIHSIDMRKGIDSLAGLVTNDLQKDPLTGDLFIFLNKRRNQIKLLHWQGDGFAVFLKRLEKGIYEIPSYDNGSKSSLIKSEQLLFILQGVVLKSIRKHKRYSRVIVDK